jgi:hypothetical protein
MHHLVTRDEPALSSLTYSVTQPWYSPLGNVASFGNVKDYRVIQHLFYVL